MSPPASKDILPPGLGPRDPLRDPVRAGTDPAPTASSAGSRQPAPLPGSRSGIPIGQIKSFQETNSSTRLQEWPSNAVSLLSQPGSASTDSRAPEIPERDSRQTSYRIREPDADRRPVPAGPTTPGNLPSSPATAPAANAALITPQPLPLDTQYLGPWLPRGSASCLAAPRLLPPSHQRCRSLSASSSTSPTLGLLVIRAHADSGCSGSLTNNGGALVNLQPCNERFKAADGLEYKASHIGDMPVVAKDSTGRHRRLEIGRASCRERV